MDTPLRPLLVPVALLCIAPEGGFWKERIETVRTATLPYEYVQCKETGRIDAFRLDWKPGQPNPPHVFFDSDVAKWVEACAYALTGTRDRKVETLMEGVVDLIRKAQQPDGYLNCHFTVVEPDKRWTNLRDLHELYCAGHLIEAAVAHFQATGRREFLDTMCRYADYIDSVFGREPGKKRGYPGHEEIELALVKLYRATGNERYLKLATYFIDERGRQPHYYDIEAEARGEEPEKRKRTHDYNQSHIPVREQKTAEGHAVRAMYLYSGMADVAAETGDKALYDACVRLWKNVTERRMYVTGSVGSSAHGERFTVDYDLPNEAAYTETCAAIGLVLFAHRMLQFRGDGVYADVMERALYNGVLSGLSRDGERFFYRNPLAVYPQAAGGPEAVGRQPWFGCACCPPNIARLIASFPAYQYSTGNRALYVHLYAGGRVTVDVAGQPLTLVQETDYPWSGRVRLTVQPAAPASFTLALRIPGWCEGASLLVQGEPVDAASVEKRGYAHLKRRWQPGDTVELELPMPVRRVHAHPAVRFNTGRVALQRGPLVYCVEEIDNGPDLNALALPREAEIRATFDKTLLGGATVLSGKALRVVDTDWRGTLYRADAPRAKSVRFKAIPYYLWANRKLGEMLVWLRESE